MNRADQLETRNQIDDWAKSNELKPQNYYRKRSQLDVDGFPKNLTLEMRCLLHGQSGMFTNPEGKHSADRSLRVKPDGELWSASCGECRLTIPDFVAHIKERETLIAKLRELPPEAPETPPETPEAPDADETPPSDETPPERIGKTIRQLVETPPEAPADVAPEAPPEAPQAPQATPASETPPSCAEAPKSRPVARESVQGNDRQRDRQSVGIRFDDFVNELDRRGLLRTKRGKGYSALCPAHDDQKPSLEVDPSTEYPGGIAIYCHTGCSFESILEALGLKGAGYEKPIKTPYHQRKGVKVHSPAYLSNDDLIIPLFDMNGNRCAIQTIWPEKRILDGKETDKFTKGKGKNNYFFQFGDRALSGTLLIATGYATSASLFESTGSPVTMSMDDGTLPHTLALLREENAEKELIVCCDYDARDNAKILNAVNQHNALLCYPVIANNHKADFNDLMLLYGKSAVCEVVSNARPHIIELIQAEAKTIPEQPLPQSPAIENVILRSAADIIPRSIGWLWNGWLAVGKLHLLAGAPGTAKTTIAMTWAAAISSGGKFPDGTYAERGKVLIWSSEDDPRDTLIPRLIAAGADLNNIHIIESVNHSSKGKRIFDPARDFPLLKSAVNEIGKVSFMVIDSVADAVAGDAGKNNQVRRALAPVKDFSEEMGIATLGITHFNKNVSGKVISRIIDSVAFVGLPRVVMVAFKQRGNGSLIMRAKSNIGPDDGGYEFYTFVEPLIGYDGIAANRVGWKGYVEGSADEHLMNAENGNDQQESALDKAKNFLLMEMADGCRRESGEIEAKAEANGISTPTLRRAKKELGWLSRKIGDKWFIIPADDARDGGV